MFEITYNDADALERYEEEKRAYPGAKYDFTFEKRFLVYHADMLHQIIYTTLMKATIAEAIGFDGSDDEKELLERQVNGLNDKMIAIVNESIASGEDIESREAEIKEIADTIEDLKRRIQIITENSMKNAEYADRIAEIERIITERASHQNEYDDSIVRQMVECIKVYADKHIEVIFGGGYTVEETVE